MSKEKLIPELRFPDFENEGEWEDGELGNHCEITTGKLDANAMVENGQYRFYTCAKDYYYIDNYAFNTDALLISGNGANVGYIHHYNGKFNAYQRTYILDNFDKDIHYVQYFLERNLKARIASEKKDGNTPYIVRSTLSEMQILSPKNKLEQQKIASCLSSLDELIAAHNDKLDALKDHKKGLLQNLFPQEGERVPKFRFPEFENDGEWVEKKLGDLTEKIGDGIHTTPKYDDSGDYFFINGNNLIDGKIYVGEKTKRVSRLEYEKHKKELNETTVLLSINGTIGNVAFYNKESVVLGKSACYMTPNQELNSIFLFYSLQCPKITSFFFSELTGSTIKNLSLRTIRETAFGLPTIQEQQKIASCLSALDELITAQQEKIEQLKMHKKGLMQGLFPSAV